MLKSDSITFLRFLKFLILKKDTILSLRPLKVLILKKDANTFLSQLILSTLWNVYKNLKVLRNSEIAT